MESKIDIPATITLPQISRSTVNSDKIRDFIHALKEMGFEVTTHGEGGYFYRINAINGEEVQVSISEAVSVLDNNWNAKERTTFKFGKTYKSEEFISRINRIVESSKQRRLTKEKSQSSRQNNETISKELQEIVMNTTEPVREEMKKYFKKMVWSVNDAEITCAFNKEEYTTHLQIVFTPEKKIKRVTILKDVLDATYSNSSEQFKEKTDELIQTIQYYNLLVKWIDGSLKQIKKTNP